MAAYSIGEFCSALGNGIAIKYFRIKTLMLTVTLSLVVGSLLYGTGVRGEMLIIGRIFQGVCSGGGATLLRVYLGETSNIAMKLKGEDKVKSQIKNTSFLWAFGLGGIALSLGPGECSGSRNFWLYLPQESLYAREFPPPPPHMTKAANCYIACTN